MGVAVRDGDRFYELRHLGDGVWEKAVYDLAADSEKRVSLFDADDPIHMKMLVRLEEYKKLLTSAAVPGRARVAPVDEERQIELLRSLGYIE